MIRLTRIGAAADNDSRLLRGAPPTCTVRSMKNADRFRLLGT